MERKIGEIFEYNGEWYQCVEWIGSCCEHCDLKFNECNEKCDCDEREDGKNIIFKKLEKVGNPYVYNGTTCQLYKSPIPIYATSSDYKIVRYDMIEVAIKQNQEDMEEKKYELEKLLAAFVNSKITYAEYEEKLEDYYKSKYGKGNIEEKELNLKEFNLEAAKQGKPVFTRDGRKARIICFDAKRKDEKNIIALVPSKDYPGFEDLISYPNNGNYYGGHENDGDLMMLPEKKEGWVNVAKEPLCDDEVVLGYIFNSYEDAVRSGKANERYVATVRIEWEG